MSILEISSFLIIYQLPLSIALQCRQTYTCKDTYCIPLLKAVVKSQLELLRLYCTYITLMPGPYVYILI